VDIRADIYSLGATFYFCMTGRTPFAEGTVAQKLIWHQTRQPKSVRTLRSDIPDGVVAVLEKMMAKDPAQRYQEPLDVAEALSPWTQTPIQPPPDNEMPKFSLAAAPRSMVGNADSLGVSGRQGADSSPAPRKGWQVAGGPLTPPPSNPSGSGPVHAPHPVATATRPLASPPIPQDTLPASAQTAPVARPAPAPAPPAPVAQAAPIPRQAPPPRPAAPEARPAPAWNSGTAPAVPVAPAALPVAQAAPAAPVALAAPAPVARPASVQTAAPAPLKQAPAPSAAPAAIQTAPAEEIDEEEAPWSPDSDSALTRSAPGSGSRVDKKPKSSSKAGLLVIGIFLVGGLVVLPTVALTGYFLFNSTVGPGGATAKARPPLKVNPAERKLYDVFKSLSAGDHILLTGDVQEANLVLDKVKNVTLEAAPGVRVTWKCPPNPKKDSKLLMIQAAEGVRVRGITFDGANEAQLEALVQLYGHCPGTRLEGLTFTNAGRSDVMFANCEGVESDPVVCQGLTFGTPQNKASVFFHIFPHTAKAIPANRFIQFRDCRFLGAGSHFKAPQPDFVGPAVELPPGEKTQN
jgi:hypothetical protein